MIFFPNLYTRLEILAISLSSCYLPTLPFTMSLSLWNQPNLTGLVSLCACSSHLPGSKHLCGGGKVRWDTYGRGLRFKVVRAEGQGNEGWRTRWWGLKVWSEGQSCEGGGTRWWGLRDKVVRYKGQGDEGWGTRWWGLRDKVVRAEGQGGEHWETRWWWLRDKIVGAEGQGGEGWGTRW